MAMMVYVPTLSIATGSSGLPGRWLPTFSVPPCLKPPAGAAVVSVAPPVAAVLPSVDDSSSSPPQAAMIDPMNATLRPTTLPLTRKLRRESEPWANPSMTSACSGPVLLRSLSKSEAIAVPRADVAPPIGAHRQNLVLEAASVNDRACCIGTVVPR
ncbi:MAG: hypothetical protein WD023_01610 [Ilumatobacteraceae bacterium]